MALRGITSTGYLQKQSKDSTIIGSHPTKTALTSMTVQVGKENNIGREGSFSFSATFNHSLGFVLSLPVPRNTRKRFQTAENSCTSCVLLSFPALLFYSRQFQFHGNGNVKIIYLVKFKLIVFHLINCLKFMHYHP